VRSWPSVSFLGRLAFCVCKHEQERFWEDETQKGLLIELMKKAAKGIPVVLYDENGEILYCSSSEKPS